MLGVRVLGFRVRGQKWEQLRLGQGFRIWDSSRVFLENPKPCTLNPAGSSVSEIRVPKPFTFRV